MSIQLEYNKCRNCIACSCVMYVYADLECCCIFNLLLLYTLYLVALMWQTPTAAYHIIHQLMPVLIVRKQRLLSYSLCDLFVKGNFIDYYSKSTYITRPKVMWRLHVNTILLSIACTISAIAQGKCVQLFLKESPDKILSQTSFAKQYQTVQFHFYVKYYTPSYYHTEYTIVILFVDSYVTVWCY